MFPVSFIYLSVFNYQQCNFFCLFACLTCQFYSVMYYCCYYYYHILSLNTYCTLDLLCFLFFCCSSPLAVCKEDFRRTACTSLLQHVVETSRQRSEGVEGGQPLALRGNEFMSIFCSHISKFRQASLGRTTPTCLLSLF